MSTECLTCGKESCACRLVWSASALRTPTVHLNGTARATLRDGYRTALRALRTAQEALREAAPNARDYYPQGEGAFHEARDQHAAREQALRQVEQEISDLLEAVSR